jgi:ketosteroid isomerase-like protein
VVSISEPDIHGADRVREVFARVRNGDLSVVDLYAEDAVVVYGEGGRVEGRDAIRAFYQRAIDGIRPQPIVEAVLEAPPLYVALVDVPGTDVHHRALDLFEIDDGGIRRLEIYTRK